MILLLYDVCIYIIYYVDDATTHNTHAQCSIRTRVNCKHCVTCAQQNGFISFLSNMDLFFHPLRHSFDSIRKSIVLYPVVNASHIHNIIIHIAYNVHIIYVYIYKQTKTDRSALNDL